MRILHLPPCPDIQKLHDYMKTNFQIEESHQMLTDSVFDFNGNKLSIIVEPPYFSPKSPYLLKHWQKEKPDRAWGNGVTCFGNHTWVVLPDGYSLTDAQIAMIEAYAENPT